MSNEQPKQQTAVEWYHYTMELLLEYENLRLKNAYKKILREAKQMEKDKMIKFAKYVLEDLTVMDYYDYEDFEELLNKFNNK